MRKPARRIVFFIILLHIPFSLLALNLNAEIERLEKKVQSGAGDKYEALADLGYLLQLAGELEKASLVWLEAASLDQAHGNKAFLEAASCFVAMGDMDKAMSTLQLIKTNDTALQFRTRYLEAYVQTFMDRNTNSFEALLSDPQSTEYMPALYYMLGRLGKTAYFNKLLEEYPQSPEAKLLEGQNVKPVYTALWFFYPSWESDFSVLESIKQEIVQVGLFGNKENADLMLEKLSASGFSSTALIVRRTVNEKEYWAVGVKPGIDTKKTIAALKAVGFDAFLVSLQEAL